MSKDIFISHAVADKNLVDKFVDLIETGIGVSSNDIFCTSLEGTGIPTGKNFIDFIKSQIENPKVVFLILTPNYMNSLFCLCELGATWALESNIIPILVKPLAYEDMKAVLTAVQASKINDETDLSEIRDKIIADLEINDPIPTSRWDAKKKKFLSIIPAHVEELENIKNPTLDEFNELKNNYEESLNEINKLENELKEINIHIEEIKKH